MPDTIKSPRTLDAAKLMVTAVPSVKWGAGVPFDARPDATPPREPVTAHNSFPADPLAALIHHAATNLSAPPRYHASNAVPCRGDKLSRIIWRGEQWAVTSYGIEARDGTYAITKHRLWENEDRHGWIEHMAGKGWVDLQDFAEALRLARHKHARHPP
jgi:hypothetical protein